MRVAVTDDDKVIAEKMKTLIEKADPQAEIDLYRSGEEMLLSGRMYDLVYLDIRMEGADGILTARRLFDHQKDVLLIFVSALRESVFSALDVHPYHFLLKPLDEEQFLRVYHEACAARREREQQSGGHLLVRSRKENILLPAREILYIESRSRKLEIHTAQRVHEMYGALNAVAETLGGSFYRSHRAYLVNMEWIRSYQPDSIELRNGEKIYLTRKKYGAFVKAYMWFLNRQHGIS